MLVKIRFDGNSRRTYTYAWPDSAETLADGDRVVVPGNDFDADPKLATVEGVGSDYTGPVKDLLGVVRGPYILGPDGGVLE